MFGNVENSVFSTFKKIIIYFSNKNKNDKLTRFATLTRSLLNGERYLILKYIAMAFMYYDFTG